MLDGSLSSPDTRREHRSRLRPSVDRVDMLSTRSSVVGQRESACAVVRDVPTRLTSAHLVGVCGSGMKALAELLTGQGCRVTGSDSHLSEARAALFEKRGLRVHAGHQTHHVDPRIDVLVYSPAVGPSNPERQYALAEGIPQMSYSQMLGWLMRDKIGISIAGTHGKSTTTAMTGCVLRSAGLLPSVVIGAEVRGVSQGGWSGTGPHFVVESCEFQRSFLDLSPRFAAILGIEPDHFDYFQNFDETISAFKDFALRLPSDGALLISNDCIASKTAVAGLQLPIETFSLSSGADWWAADLRPTTEGVRFRAFWKGEFFAEIGLRVPGRHNVLNSLAAMALCHQAGVDSAAIREGLAEFRGISRRFEAVGMWRGVLMIDDYAHHPTAVSVTLKTARERFPDRRLWCIFQPHQVSRTQALMTEFATSLTAADEVLLVPVFAARELVNNEADTASQFLAGRIVAEGGRARFAGSLDHAVATLEDELRPGDVLITMGAGDIGQVHHAFTRQLQRHPHAG